MQKYTEIYRDIRRYTQIYRDILTDLQNEAL